MVLDFYKLREQPFGVTPDPRYLYASATHREALASILYGVEVGRGFVALIAKPGMGKTTLLFHALHQLQDRAKTVFLYQTICTPADFLRAVLADLGFPETPTNLIELQSKLNEVVTEQSRLGKQLVIVIDEAQILDASVLELVRMLSNFETSRQKLIQIVLSGQPQLANKLASTELIQLRQRVSIFACLKPFSLEETALYVDHRIRTAGYSAEAPLFTKGAMELIARCSEGVPRNINNLCFNALSLGCALKRRTIDRDIVREVVTDLDLEPLREKKAPAPRIEEDDRQQAHAVITAVASAVPMAAIASPMAAIASPMAASASPVMKNWIQKLGTACAVLILLGGVIVQSRRWMTPKDAARANSGMPLQAAASPASPDTAAAGLIRVTPGQTLYWICVENFGSCNSQRLQEIQALNPWLTNLNHIEAGQLVRMPSVQGVSVPKPRISEQSENTLPKKRGTQ